MVAVVGVLLIYAVLATLFSFQQRALRLKAEGDSRDSRVQAETMAVVSGRNDAWLRGMITNLTSQGHAFTEDQVKLVTTLTTPTATPTFQLPTTFTPEESDEVTKIDDFDPTDRWDPPMSGRVSYIVPKGMPGPGE